MLIKCPECGREGVSDKAEACPSCGYGIRKHFEDVKGKEEKTISNKFIMKENVQDTAKSVTKNTNTSKIIQDDENKIGQRKKILTKKHKELKQMVITFFSILAVFVVFALVVQYNSSRKDVAGNYSTSSTNSTKSTHSSNTSGSSSKPRGSSSPDSSSSKYTGTYDATLEYQEGNVVIASSKDYLNQYIKDCTNSNTSDINSLEAAGKIGTVEKGTKCNIVDSGVLICSVKLLEGSNAGKTVYVITESVKKHKN